MDNSDLEAENLQLRQQLESLLREARNNEDKMRRFEQLEHRLIGARSMAELLRLLLNEYRLSFGIDSVTLALLDQDQETSALLEAERPREDQAERAQLDGLTLLHSLAPIESLFQDLSRPSLGPFNESLHRPLFGTPSPALASVALLPLSRHGGLIGSLHFGSTDPARYERAAGTKLLERLGAIVSVCLDNALNHERLKRAGLSDMLTGVHNRRYFEHRSQIEVSQARRYQHDLACLFLDLDHFKTVNDSFGHAAGDAVLQRVAHIIQAQLRAGDTVARFGGEEFVVLLPQAPAQHARDIAERIRLSISAAPLTLPGGEAVPVSVSIGLAMLAPSHLGGDSPSLALTLVNQADRALYRAKAAGRNQVCFAG
jgi:two-component system cell cycle response regulator